MTDTFDPDVAIGDYERVCDELEEATEFIDWLLEMDDPMSEEGVRCRQTITLTEILRRAREVREGSP